MKTNMLFWCISVAFVLLLSSCATIFNQKTAEVSVYANQPFQLSHKDNTLYSVQTGYREKGHVVRFYPERSKDSLRFTIHNETDTAEYKVKSNLSPTLICNALTYGTGLIVDFMNKKRFGYPRNVILTEIENPFDQQEVPQKFKTSFAKPRKGMITLNVGLPTFNFINTYSDLYKKHQDETVTFGISLGTDYYYNQNKFFNLTAGITSDLSSSSQGSVYVDDEDYSHCYRAQTFYTSLTHNHRFNDIFVIGYGLSYGINWWQNEKIIEQYRFIEDEGHIRKLYDFSVRKVTEKRHVMGMMFHAHLTPGEVFFAGVDYRPTFFRFQRHDKFNYEHLISITFGCKIKLKGGK